MLKGISRKRLQNKQRSNDMKKITSKLVAVLMIVVMAFGISGTATVKTEAKESKGYVIKVNLGTNCTTVYKNGKAIKAMICSVGANDGTPSGVFNTCAKYTWRPLFGNVYGQYATRINGNILFHSVYYKTTDPSSLKTVEYNKLGQAVSMGCVRLTTADAKWIYDNCSLGTQVTIINNGTDPLGRPKSIYLGKNASYPNWDPTDPNVNNPWHKEGVKFLADYSSLHKTINASDNLTSQQLADKIREGVTAYDTANNVISYDLSYNIHPTAVGEYEVKYYATDILGRYAEIYGTLTIK